MTSHAYNSLLWEQAYLQYCVTRTLEQLELNSLEEASNINVRTLYKRIQMLTGRLTEVNKTLHLIDYHDIPGTYRADGPDLALPAGETVVLNVIEPDYSVHKAKMKVKL